MCLPHDLEQAIRDAAMQSFPDPAAPPRTDDLTCWLNEQVSGTIDQFAATHPLTGPQRVEAVALTIAVLYGDAAERQVTTPELAALVQATGLDWPVEERAIERTLVFYLRPQPPGDGSPSGPDSTARALTVLWNWIIDIIAPTLRWYDLYLQLPDCPREEPCSWLFAEQQSCAFILARHLRDGCCCWLEPGALDRLALNPVDAQRRCQTEHTLHSWKHQTSSLHHFLFRAVVHAPVHLGHAGPEGNVQAIAHINGHRYGMLPVVALDGTIHARPIPSCPRDTCPGGEIDPRTDRCSGCGQLSEMRDPPSGLYLPGQRRPVLACRCGRQPDRGHPMQPCNYIYFQFEGCPCPRDSSHTWSRRPTELWCRLPRPHGGDAVANQPAGGRRPDEEAAEAESLERLSRALAALDDPDTCRLAEAVLLEGNDVTHAAELHGLTPDDRRFLSRLADVLRAVVPEAERQAIIEGLSPRVPPARRERVQHIARQVLLTRDDLAAVAAAVGTHPDRSGFRGEVLAVLLMTVRAVRGLPNQEPNEEDDQ